MKLSLLIEKVKVRIDEVIPGSEERMAISSLKKPIDTYIEEALNSSVRSVLTSVPVHRINPVSAKWGCIPLGSTATAKLTIDIDELHLSGVSVISYSSNTSSSPEGVSISGQDIIIWYNNTRDTFISNLLLSNGAFFPNIFDGEETTFGIRASVSGITSKYNETISDNISAVKLPNEILKIQKAKLSSWDSFSTEFIPPNHPLYALQTNRYARGGQSKPVIVKEDNKTLKFYTAKDVSDTVETLDIVTDLKPQEIQDDLVDILCWYAAAEYFVISKIESKSSFEMISMKINELI